MKYEQPYGVSDPNASYINGNPSTGTMGSIPPAASIENPQREIVNFLTDSGLVPADSDLHQLSKSVQNGMVNYCNDAGTPNFIAITPTPPLAGYALGQCFTIKVANNNTGPVNVNVSNIGWAPVVHGDKTPMVGGELFAGQIIVLAYDGAGHWQMITGGVSGQVIMLTAPRTLYVNASTGSDTAYDGTQPTVDATQTHGPFLTLRHALATTAKYNLGGYQFTIQMADGVYGDPNPLIAPIPNGSGNIFIQGNPGSPSNVRIVNNGSGSVFRVEGGQYFFNGVSFQGTAAGGNDSGEGLWLEGGAAQVWLDAVNFYAVPDCQLLVTNAATCILQGPIGIIGGSMGYFMAAEANALIGVWPSPFPTLNIYGGTYYAQYFCLSMTGAQVTAIFAAINGYGNVSGNKYSVTGNGVLSVGGRGTGYLPGSGVGVQTTGGQYL